MALGRKDVSVATTNGGADIFRLTGLLGDNNLIRHRGLVWWTGFESAAPRTYSELTAHRKSPSGRFASGRGKRYRVVQRTGAVDEPPAASPRILPVRFSGSI